MMLRAANRPSVLVRSVLVLLVVGGGVALAFHYRHNADKCFTVLVITAVGIAAVVALTEIAPVYPIALGFASSVFSGNWSYIGIPFGIDRPLLLYGMAAVLVQALPDVRRRTLPPMKWIGWWLIGLSFYAIGNATIAGTLTSHDAGFALLDQLGLIGFGLFVLAPAIFVHPSDRDVLLLTFVVLGAYLGLISFFEEVHANALIFPRYINNPALGITYGRARGPFLASDANGLVMYACAVASTIGLARWKGRVVRSRICAAVIVLCLLGIVFTLTRQVWIGSAVATFVTMLVLPSLRRLVIPAGLLATVLVLGAFAFVPGLDKSASSRANTTSSVWDRLNSDAAGLRMLDARPAFGFGWYEFGTDSTPYFRQAATYPLTYVGRIHNVFLSLAVELGLVGFAGWFVAFMGVQISAIRRRGSPEVTLWRTGGLAIALNWIIVANFTPLGYAFPNHLIWLWPGVVVAASLSGSKQPVTELSPASKVAV